MLSGVNAGSGGTGGANSGGSGYGGEAGTWNIVGAGEAGGTRLDPNAGGFWLNKDGSSGAGSGSGTGTGAGIPGAVPVTGSAAGTGGSGSGTGNAGDSGTWNILGGNAEGTPIDPNAGGFWLNKEDSSGRSRSGGSGRGVAGTAVHGGGSGHGEGSGDFGGGTFGGGTSGGGSGGGLGRLCRRIWSGSGVGNTAGSNSRIWRVPPGRARILRLEIPAVGRMLLREFEWGVPRARRWPWLNVRRNRVDDASRRRAARHPAGSRTNRPHGRRHQRQTRSECISIAAFDASSARALHDQPGSFGFGGAGPDGIVRHDPRF